MRKNKKHRRQTENFNSGMEQQYSGRRKTRKRVMIKRRFLVFLFLLFALVITGVFFGGKAIVGSVNNIRDNIETAKTEEAISEKKAQMAGEKTIDNLFTSAPPTQVAALTEQGTNDEDGDSSKSDGSADAGGTDSTDQSNTNTTDTKEDSTDNNSDTPQDADGNTATKTDNGNADAPLAEEGVENPDAKVDSAKMQNEIIKAVLSNWYISPLGKTRSTIEQTFGTLNRYEKWGGGIYLHKNFPYTMFAVYNGVIGEDGYPDADANCSIISIALSYITQIKDFTPVNESWGSIFKDENNIGWSEYYYSILISSNIQMLIYCDGEGKISQDTHIFVKDLG